MENIHYFIPVSGVLALIFAAWKASWVKKQDAGNETMQEIAARIQEGAMAFLFKEYSYLTAFVLGVAALLFWQRGQETAIAFIFGAVCSVLADSKAA